MQTVLSVTQHININSRSELQFMKRSCSSAFEDGTSSTRLSAKVPCGRRYLFYAQCYS